MVYIYILELENSKYYIGKTSNPDFRLNQHFNSLGSQWTMKYKPIKIIKIIPNCDDYDENKYTNIYMDKYGINNVRGGSFVKIILDESTIEHLERMNRGTNDNCFLCGSTEHFIKNCNNKNINEACEKAINQTEKKEIINVTNKQELLIKKHVKEKIINRTKILVQEIQPLCTDKKEIINNTNEQELLIKKTIQRCKKQIDETKIKTTGITLYEQTKITEIELNNLPLWQQYLYLICDQDDYNIRKAIGYSISNSGGTKEDYINYSKLNKEKYTENECDCFKYYKINNTGYTIRTLRFLARKCNEKYFNDQNLLHEFFTININGISMIEEKTKYLSSNNGTNIYNDNIITNCKSLILHAEPGSGKSHQIKRLIIHHKYTEILCVTSRISFAEFIHKELDLIIYSDLNNDYTNAKKLAVQLESLYKINEDIKYELVILDECESILKQFSSETMRDKVVENFNVLHKVLSKAKKIIYADAFISQRTIDFALSITKNTNILYLKNTYKGEKKYNAIEIDGTEIEEKIIDKIKNKKNIYYCSSLKNNIISIEQKLTSEIKGIYYYSNNDNITDKTLKNVEESWKDKQIIGTSPIIATGISFADEKIKHFDYCFFSGYPTCCARENLQQIKRVRYLKDETVYFSLPKKINSKNENIFYNEVIDFNDYTTENKKMMLIKLKEYMLENAEELIKTHTYEQYQKFILLLEPSKMDINLKNILYYNIKESLLSKMYYRKMILYYFELCNYDVTLLNKKECKPIKKTSENYVSEYEKITIILKNDVETINKKIKKCEATTKEKESAHKYYYKNLIIIKMNIEMESRIFYEYFMNPIKKKYLENMCYEKNNKCDNLTNTIEIRNCQVKLTYIKKLNELLGINNSQDLITIMDKKNIETKVYPYLKNNYDEIKKIFDLKAKLNENEKGHGYYNVMNSIYKLWNGNILKINIKNKSKHCAINYRLSGESFYEYL